MGKHLGLVAFVPGLLLLATLPASAENVTINSVNPSLTGTITYGGNALPGESKSQLFSIGSLSTTISGLTFDTYCIDLNHSFTPVATWSVNPQTTFDSVTTGPQADTDLLNDSSSTVKVLSGVSTYQELAYLVDNYAAGATTADKAAALQIALWTVEYGSGVTVTLTSDQSIVSGLVNQEVLAATTASNLGLAAATFYVFNGSNPNTPHQDLIGFSPGLTNPFAVPEPSSVAMMAMGLGVVAFRFRKARLARRDA